MRTKSDRILHRIFLYQLGDYDHGKVRRVNLTRVEGDRLVGVVEGLVVRLRPREIFKKDGTRFTKRELKALLSEVVDELS